jgi:hypothetical protein
MSRGLWKEPSSDSEDGLAWSDSDSEDGELRLNVKPSMIPNAGDGLFLASAMVEGDTTLLEEEAISLKRCV